MRVAMVSGASRGVGAAIAAALEEAGWTLSLGLRDPTRLPPLARPEAALIHPWDATDREAATPWVEATAARFGRIDALVNNAGILRMVDFERGSEDDLDDLWTVNVKAPFRLIRAALPHLRATGAGRIVNLASTDAKRYRAGTSVGYAMTKHALLAMTQAARMAGWDDGVRACALCPGAIDTELLDGIAGATPRADRLTPATVAGLVATILSLPNQASLPELVVNTRLESLI